MGWDNILLANLSRFFYSFKDVHVHIGESNEGNDGGGDGGVPDYGQCVPEDVGWVLPGLTWLYKAGSV